MDWHSDIDLFDQLKLLRTRPNPKLNSGIPAARYNTSSARVDHASYIFNRLVVTANNHELVLAQIPAPYVIVSTSKKKSCCFLLPTHAQNRHLRALWSHCLELGLGSTWRISIVVNSPNKDCAIPTGNCNHLLAISLTLLRSKLDFADWGLALQLHVSVKFVCWLSLLLLHLLCKAWLLTKLVGKSLGADLLLKCHCKLN